MERRDSTGNGTGNGTGSGTGSGFRNTGSSMGSGSRDNTGDGSWSGSRNIENNTGSGPGNSTGSGPGNSPGSGPGNSPGSGRAAPPGGPGRALLCLALLLPALLPPPARALPAPARALPGPPRHRHPLPRCLSRSWDLLEAANASLHRLKERDTLRFNCTFEEVDLEDITENQINTIRACTAEEPGLGNCPVLERTTFNEEKCLEGISEDLRAYRTHLRKLEDPQLLLALDALMEALGNCSGKGPEAPLGLGSTGSTLGPSPGSTLGSSPGSTLGSSLGSTSGSSLGSTLGSSLGSTSGSSLGPSLGSSPGLESTPFPERMRLCGALLAFRIRSVTISRMLSFLSSL